jgi:hypothetical protein
MIPEITQTILQRCERYELKALTPGPVASLKDRFWVQRGVVLCGQNSCQERGAEHRFYKHGLTGWLELPEIASLPPASSGFLGSRLIE